MQIFEWLFSHVKESRDEKVAVRERMLTFTPSPPPVRSSLSLSLSGFSSWERGGMGVKSLF